MNCKAARYGKGLRKRNIKPYFRAPQRLLALKNLNILMKANNSPSIVVGRRIMSVCRNYQSISCRSLSITA